MQTIGVADEEFQVQGKNGFLVPLRLGLWSRQRPDAVINRVRQALEMEEEIPLWTILERSSQRHHFSGEYWRTPMDLTLALEAVSSSVLHAAWKLLDSDKCVLPFGLVQKLRGLQTAVNDLCAKNNLPAYSFFPTNRNEGWSKACLELRQWEEKCYRFRNRVVHDGDLRVAQGDSWSAIVATETAIGFLLALPEHYGA